MPASRRLRDLLLALDAQDTDLDYVIFLVKTPLCKICPFHLTTRVI